MISTPLEFIDTLLVLETLSRFILDPIFIDAGLQSMRIDFKRIENVKCNQPLYMKPTFHH